MIRLRIPAALHDVIFSDLQRPHSFALERIGFLCCHEAETASGHVLLAYRYEGIKDNQYINDDSVGARFDSSAIRFGMQLALSDQASVFHVHIHPHFGCPRFSRVDDREMASLMPCFVNVCPTRMHGALIFSSDRACARIWRRGEGKPLSVDRITSVGQVIGVLS